MPSSPAAPETRRCAPSERALSFASSSPWRPVVGRVRAVTRVEARRRKGHGALLDRPAPRGGGRGEVGGSPPAAPAAPQPRAASRRTSPWTARPSWGLVAISARGGGDLQYTNQTTAFLPSPWSRRVLSGYFNARAGADGGGPADVPRATGRQWARACGIGRKVAAGSFSGPPELVSISDEASSTACSPTRYCTRTRSAMGALDAQAGAPSSTHVEACARGHGRELALAAGPPSQRGQSNTGPRSRAKTRQ